MKTLKTTLKMLPILLLIVLVSCKKKQVMPEQEVKVTTPVTAKELLDYYIVVEHKTGADKLLVVYFDIDGSQIVARARRQGDPGVKVVAVNSVVDIENGQFSVDWNRDGRTAVYRFTIENDASGTLKMKTYDFQFNGEGNLLAYGVMAKKTEALPFAGYQFKMIRENVPFDQVKSGIPVAFTSFLGSKTLFWSTRDIDHQLDGYTEILNIGFTTKANLLGVTVPYWKSINTPIMLIEIEELLFLAAKQ